MLGQKLNGALNLDKIPANLIRTNSRGERVIYIDVLENKNGPDQYGNTHAVTLYDKTSGQTVYLANLKPQQFGAFQPGAQAPAQAQPTQQGNVGNQGYMNQRPQTTAPNSGFMNQRPQYQGQPAQATQPAPGYRGLER